MTITSLSFTLVVFIQILTWFLLYSTFNQCDDEIWLHSIICINDNAFTISTKHIFHSKNIP